jgi:dipeptidyl aminopeptidase/acylaminoacyl peptidase
MRRLLLIVGAIVIILGILSFVFFKFSLPKKAQDALTRPVKAVLTAVPTAIPFADMTIPYLRSRTYKSTLGERTEVQNYANYTGYLTSYESDGNKINGLLTIPKGEMPANGWPAIVFVHGYIPPTQYATLEKYVAYVDYLARNGFVVFKIDLRGHGQSEGRPSGAYYSSGYVIDTLNAYSALQNANFVNPKKIGLWGHSMAGNVTLRAFAAKPDIPAVVIWGGAGFSYTDLLKYRITDQSYRPQPTTSLSPSGANSRKRLTDVVGEVTDTNPFWKIVAPTNYINDFKGAIALHHAVDDNTVNVQYSRDLNALLDKSTVPHEYYEYPVGDHNIADPSFGTAMQRTVDFYKKYLAE